MSGINCFTAANPNVRVWVVTRRFDLAAQLVPRANLFLQLSLDASTQPAAITHARHLVATHPRAYFSFLRTASNDDTMGASIVFNEKRTRGLPYESRTDCPVDAGRLPLGNIRGVGGTACARCRKCFTELTVIRQRTPQLVSG